MSTTTPLAIINPVETGGSVIKNESIIDLDLNATEYIPVVAAATIFGTLVATGALAVIIFTAVLIRGRKKLEEFPFFVIVWHLTIANGIHITFVITTVLPVMLMEIDAGDTWNTFLTWGSRAIELSEQAALYFTLLMAVNRFAVFVLPSMMCIFTRFRIMVIAMFIWLYVTFIVYWNVKYGTTKVFSKKALKKLTAGDTLLGTNVLTQIFTLLSTALPFVMMGIYILIFIFILKKRGVVEDKKRARRDRSLLWQALAVTIVLELSKISNIVTPYVEGSTTLMWSWTIFSYSLSILNQMINPTLFLLFNRMIRQILKNLFKDQKSSAWVSESTSSPSGPNPAVKFFTEVTKKLFTPTPVDRNTFVI